ncbi:hypothetical protein DFS34DRAFT_697933 [Phlyctochytrium arcticum]|nr:hypothetical protein DFS34DRAFT_697933 [Phlyctochytrium arcticum]
MPVNLYRSIANDKAAEYAVVGADVEGPGVDGPCVEGPAAPGIVTGADTTLAVGVADEANTRGPGEEPVAEDAVGGTGAPSDVSVRPPW